MKNMTAYENLWFLANQVMISRALYVAADLQLADCVTTPLSLNDLAEKIVVNAQALQRLLRCLIESGVFAYDQNGLICNNDASQFLQ